tara:strand:- start:104 stop:580 length:477 start_codon:yes stop_codon:yes gene_type:complete
MPRLSISTLYGFFLKQTFPAFLDTYGIVCTQDSLYPTLTHLLQSILDRGKTALVFLPGKYEISDVAALLKKGGVEARAIVPFHGELEFEQLEKAKIPTHYPRIVLATSKAETSLTLADADFVVDLGLSRGIDKTDDLLEIQTFAAPATNREQRRGRVL